MKVWRVVSLEELSLFDKGNAIKAQCNFNDKRNSFSGRGICFFKNASNCVLWHSLNCNSEKKEVVCQFEIDKDICLQGEGCYADFNSDDGFVEIEECCVKEYSKDNAELIDYFVVDQHELTGEIIQTFIKKQKIKIYANFFNGTDDIF